MSEVFISYKREDRPRIDAIAQGLRRAGLSVWLDVDTPGGASWRQAIAEKLQAARCVLVVWSEASVSPAGEFVHDEAARARALGTLLPVRIDDVSPPVGFGEIQSLNLIGWAGSRRDPRFRDVIAAVNATVAGELRPEPKAPGRRKRIVATLASSSTLLVALVAFMADLAGIQEFACLVPGARALCRAAGLGGVPTQAEEALWTSRPSGDCQALRSYLAQFPKGTYAEEARSQLQAARRENHETWTPDQRRLALTVPAEDPKPDESAARQDALARADDQARRLCKGFDAGEHRLLSSSAEPQKWNCRPAGQGIRCGFDGQAVCKVEVRHVTQIEECP